MTSRVLQLSPGWRGTPSHARSVLVSLALSFATLLVAVLSGCGTTQQTTRFAPEPFPDRFAHIDYVNLNVRVGGRSKTIPLIEHTDVQDAVRDIFLAVVPRADRPDNVLRLDISVTGCPLTRRYQIGRYGTGYQLYADVHQVWEEYEWTDSVQHRIPTPEAFVGDPVVKERLVRKRAEGAMIAKVCRFALRMFPNGQEKLLASANPLVAEHCKGDLVP